MKQLYLLIALCLLGSFCKAQSDTTVRYYNSTNTSKNVTKAKAEYAETRFSNADSSVTIIVTNLKENKIERKQS